MYCTLHVITLPMGQSDLPIRECPIPIRVGGSAWISILQPGHFVRGGIYPWVYAPSPARRGRGRFTGPGGDLPFT